ncbi:YfhD family protein [Bacillus piscicola]|uniref:YfhD family protein n=1 Tax=Bacillus piscicola TaxID=1632684 RepID=UPI001F08AD4D
MNDKKKNAHHSEHNSTYADGLDVEFSEALADEEDHEAQERARRADERAKKKG